MHIKDDGGSEADLRLHYRKVFFGAQFAVGLTAYEHGSYNDKGKWISHKQQQVGFEIWSEADGWWSFHGVEASIYWANDLLKVLTEAQKWVDENCDEDGGYHTKLWRL